MRRTLLVAVLSAVALLATACGGLNGGDGTGPGAGSGATGPGGISHPTGSDEPILQVVTAGGFIAPSAHLTELPSFSLYGDGTVITPGAQIEIYPQPALPSLVRTEITEQGIQAILDAARSAGLLGKDASYGFDCIADAGTTTFTLHANGSVHTVSAYALGMDDSGCPGADARARTQLAAFQDKLGDLRSWLPQGSVSEDGQYEPAGVRLYVQPYVGSGDPNLQEPPIAWPLSPDLGSVGETVNEVPDTRCAVVTGDDLVSLMPDLGRANTLTPWRSGDADYGLLVRPLLPNERTC